LRFASGSRFQFLTPDRQILLLVFTAALLGRLFALQSWWCLDDWGQLARAAGHLDHSDFPVARVLSQQWYWSLMWPVAGLDAMAHALVRMVLHALAAVAVGRIALRVGQSSFGSLVSGLVFAASPVAFTVLFWASGIQELLAGLLALWAVERWLGSGSRALLVAALLGALSMLAKEPGLGLPVFFLGCCALGGNLSRPRLGVIAFLILMAGWEISLVHGHFASGDADPYSIGGLLVVLKNLGQFGYWLGLPLPVFPPQVPWPQAAWGFLLAAGAAGSGCCPGGSGFESGAGLAVGSAGETIHGLYGGGGRGSGVGGIASCWKVRPLAVETCRGCVCCGVFSFRHELAIGHQRPGGQGCWVGPGISCTDSRWLF